MTIEQKVTAMLPEALKGGDKSRLMALRAVKSVLTNERTRHAGELNDEDSFTVLGSYRKKMLKARAQYEELKREDLVKQADMEIAICDELLPPPLDMAEVENKLNEVISRVGASSMSDLGKVMGLMMKEFAGKVDGNEIRKMVQSRLGS